MKLFQPFNLKGIELSNRVIMAPLTRRRCTRNNNPVPYMADYYSQRSSAGLIIAEGTSPSPHGVGYPNMPGLFTKEHVDSWKKITTSVHEADGKIFLQIMHTGHVGHTNNLPEGAKLLAPSAIAKNGEVSTYDFGKQAYPIPEEMTLHEVEASIEEYVKCAELSMEAGFDGIEIHGAHGYLPNQFLNNSTNFRDDIYGGSEENRMRFLIEVLKKCSAKISSKKVGLRISPFSYADSEEKESEVYSIYKALTNKLNHLDLAYLHLSHMGDQTKIKSGLWKEIRQIYNGTLILCGDFTKDIAEKAIVNGEADLIAFGRDFISNPDLVERMKNNWPLEERDPSLWYTLGKKGLIDYPKFENEK